jgi:hypothetical protein
MNCLDAISHNAIKLNAMKLHAITLDGCRRRD